MRILYFLLVLMLRLEMRQAQPCDVAISTLFVRSINSTEFRYWYSSMKRLTISINARLKSSSANGTTYVLKFETVSFNITYEVSLCNNWQLLEIRISYGVPSVVPGSCYCHFQWHNRAIANKSDEGLASFKQFHVDSRRNDRTNCASNRQSGYRVSTDEGYS